NGFPGIDASSKPVLHPSRKPKIDLAAPAPNGTKQILDTEGPEGVVKWLKAQQDVLLTDTTFRDAHQSLLATRVRTADMVGIAPETASIMNDLFTLDVWGGATVDVAYRFLKENPWDRLLKLREQMPNVL